MSRHIGDPLFGMEVDWHDFLSKLFKHIPALNEIDARQTIYQFFDIDYNIFNHLNQPIKRPLADVAFHECENINDGSLLEIMMKVYIMKNIKDIFGLSLTEYLDLPIDVVDMLNKLADDELKKKSNMVGDIESQFNKTIK